MNARRSDDGDWAAAGWIDTDLSFFSFLERHRAEVAECGMAACRIVEPLDVVEHFGTRLLISYPVMAWWYACLHEQTQANLLRRSREPR